MSKIKPCPFCGGEAIKDPLTSEGCNIVCTSCHARSPWFDHYYLKMGEEEEKAIEAWNKRVEITPVDNEPTITLPIGDFEHLLNCLANQKFIHDINADGLSEGLDKVREIQKENQAVIDKAWRDGMDLLMSHKSEMKEK